MIQEITLALTSHAVGESPVRKAVWRDLRSKVAAGNPDELLDWAKSSLSPSDAEIVEQRMQLLEDASDLVNDLARDGVNVVTEFDASYPKRYIERLNDSHPALLFVAGGAKYLSGAVDRHCGLARR